MITMVKDEISRLIATAIAEAQAEGSLPPVTLPESLVERPQKPEYGDYASSIALKLVRATRGMNPLTIAETIVRHLPPADFLERVEVARPGFINFTLKPAWLQAQVERIREHGAGFGRSEIGQGKRVQVEFVSANPTGPLHMGHGRGAVLGSTLANVLDAVGYAVVREYYINDAGNQILAFARTLYARYCQELGRDVPLPPEGYVGLYMVDLAREIIAAEGDRYLAMSEEEAVAALGHVGIAKMLAAIQADLRRLNVAFDVWFSERQLFDEGIFERALAILRERGYVEEREGAVWFTSTALGEDKDSVIIRSNGMPTYFASDIAYHYEKLGIRQFDQVIDVWGADHQGHVPRMKAVVAALGFDPARLTVIISQLVTLRRGGEIVRISKRTGDLITLREVMDEVGPDVCRFFFLARSADAQMDFDLELAKKQSEENPVYYVQYAHARIASILRRAIELGVDWSAGDVARLTDPTELGLIRKMLRFPEVVEQAATSLEPHHLPHFALELATSFTAFYHACQVINPDDPHGPLTAARLKLVEAAKIALANVLQMMGMSAPERMERESSADAER